MTDREKLHKQHRDYLMAHSPVDRVIEDQGLSRDWRGNISSSFVASAGGDVSLWEVVGSAEPFTLYQR